MRYLLQMILRAKLSGTKLLFSSEMHLRSSIRMFYHGNANKPEELKEAILSAPNGIAMVNKFI